MWTMKYFYTNLSNPSSLGGSIPAKLVLGEGSNEKTILEKKMDSENTKCKQIKKTRICFKISLFKFQWSDYKLQFLNIKIFIICKTL